MSLTLELVLEIDASRNRVFSGLTDLDTCSAWMPNFVRIERETSEPFQKGTRFREVRRMFGREAGEVFEVSAFDPPNGFELYIDGTKGSSRKGWYRFRYELQPIREGSTRVQVHGEIGGLSRIGGFFFRLFLGAFKKALMKDMNAFKLWVESSSKTTGT